jgi:hypothetical protein
MADYYTLLVNILKRMSFQESFPVVLHSNTNLGILVKGSGEWSYGYQSDDCKIERIS